MISLDDHAPACEGFDVPLTHEQTIRALAFQQAGRAVVGMSLGLGCARTRVHHITLPGQAGWTGTTTWSPSRAPEFDVAVMFAAGACAARRQLTLDGLATPATLAAVAAPRDRATAISVLAVTGYTLVLDGPAPAHGATWTEVTNAADKTVTRLWPQITTAAEAVLTRPDLSLTGEEITEATGVPNPAPQQAD